MNNFNRGQKNNGYYENLLKIDDVFILKKLQVDVEITLPLLLLLLLATT